MVERPKHGARFVFERIAAEGSRARYRVTIADETGEHVALAELDSSAARVAPLTSAAVLDPWASATALGFLDVIQRGYGQEQGWPRRVQRWRAPR
ncbi:MAG: hypothetical protein U0353_13605 [Sandaracinus sp.]